MTVIGNGKILPPPERVIEPRPGDPPVFILLASPTWAPWLPDTIYQKVPIGATGQVLTVNADGSIGWSNSASGFANPMTTAGDLIEGSAGGAPIRFPIGTNGQVLTVVSGALGWVNNSAVGFTNPMTTSQDLIVGGAAGAAGRLGVGTNGQVLTVSAGGLVVWQNSAAGFANPMTTAGDLIDATTGGAPQRLPVGANGQVLTVVAGAPTWANSASGFANPMTSSGDMITGGLVGAAQRLPVGANGQVLTVVAGAPAWASGQSAASAVVFPSGDTTGVTDQAAITSSYPANGGEVILAPGKFYVKPVSGLNCLTVPSQTTAGNAGGNPVCMRGSGPSTVLYPVGASVTGIYYHRTSGVQQFGFPAQQTCGYLRDFVIDGTFATGASVGANVGDGWGYDINLTCVNFSTANAVGFVQSNDVFWTEKCRFRLSLSNNTTAMTIGATQVASSKEYNEFDIRMFCQTLQQGVVIQQGALFTHNRTRIIGNMAVTSATSGAPTNNLAALTLISAAGQNFQTQVAGGWLELEVEGNPGNGSGTVYPYILFSDGTAFIHGMDGVIAHTLSQGNMNGAEFTWHGTIVNDFALRTAWPSTAFPGLGVQWVNNGPAATVVVNGGTVTAIKVTNTTTGLTSGAFYVPSGGNLEVDGTVAPTTFNVVPAA